METRLEQFKIETGEQIAAQAREYGLSVDAYVQRLLALASDVPRTSVSDDTDKFVTAMESLAEEGTPPLPRDFSRDDLYFPEA